LFPLDDTNRPGVRFGLFAKGKASEEDWAGVWLNQQEGAVHFDSEWRYSRGRVNEEREEKLYFSKQKVWGNRRFV